MPEALVQTDANIDAVAERTYQMIAKVFGVPYETAHRQTLCVTASDFMLRALLRDGDSTVDQVERDVAGLDTGHHDYLVSTAEGSERIIDSTWQQFLPAEASAPHLPRVLIGSREEVIAQAQVAGINDPQVLDVWRPLSETVAVRRESWRLSGNVFSLGKTEPSDPYITESGVAADGLTGF